MDNGEAMYPNWIRRARLWVTDRAALVEEIGRLEDRLSDSERNAAFVLEQLQDLSEYTASIELELEPPDPAA